jgi:hypothetical protein
LIDQSPVIVALATGIIVVLIVYVSCRVWEAGDGQTDGSNELRKASMVTDRLFADRTADDEHLTLSILFFFVWL